MAEIYFVAPCGGRFGPNEAAFPRAHAVFALFEDPTHGKREEEFGSEPAQARKQLVAAFPLLRFFSAGVRS